MVETETRRTESQAEKNKEGGNCWLIQRSKWELAESEMHRFNVQKIPIQLQWEQQPVVFKKDK